MRTVALLTILLAGCGDPHCVKPQPYDTHIDPECTKSCADDLGEVDLVTAHQRCEARRKLCVNALTRGQEAGAIK